MTQSKRRRGFLATQDGVRLLRARMDQQGCTQPELVEAAGVSDDQVGRLLNPHWGYRIQKDAIVKIARALNLDPAEVVGSKWYPPAPVSLEASEADIDWREVCQVMLEEQQDTQRFRQKATERGFEVNVSHIPLALTKRVQQRRSGKFEEQWAQKLEIYEHNEFLQRAIGNGTTSPDHHVAIIGEPGAGKTTLLGLIANYILSNTENLPICITLASLQGRILAEYLLESWLPEAMKLINLESAITPGIEEQFIERLRKGGAWLLLDGADEMGVPLMAIEAQLTESNWLGKVRVVLTSRLNVWDASVNNPLVGFDTYRIGKFTPEQIDQFIEEWFTLAKDEVRGKQLQATLKQAGRQEIKNLARHPLALSMLCQTYYLDGSDEWQLTKSALYERFVRYFYEWKQKLYHINLINRDRLQQALGKLALAGINSTAKYRLKESLVSQEMGQDLFELACKLGWLNIVELDGKTDEHIYAFFHPTFQEYFAALAIDDWQYFLNHLPSNPERGTYRIFEPQWREVILFWLGRNDFNDETKEAFIKALISFDDGCGGNSFYKYQAYFLAAAGIAEFENCSLSNRIIRHLVQWGIIDSAVESSVNRGAIAALQETERTRAIEVLNDLLNTTSSHNIRRLAALILCHISNNNQAAIDALISLLLTIQDDDDVSLYLKREDIAQTLVRFAVKNEKAINNLIKTLDKTQDKHLLSLLGETITEIDSNKARASQILQRLLANQFKEEKSFDSLRIAESLAKIDPSSEVPLQPLLRFIESMSSKDYHHNTLSKAIESICIGQFPEIVSEALVHLFARIEISTTLTYREKVPVVIKRFCRNNSHMISLLIDFYKRSADEDIRILTIDVLGEIGAESTDATQFLTSLLKNTNESFIIQVAKKLVLKDPHHQEAIDKIIDLCINENHEISLEAIAILGQISNNNDSVRETLTDFLDDDYRTDMRLQAAKSLLQANPSHERAIEVLIELFDFTDNITTHFEAARYLLEIGNNHPKVISSLTDALTKSEDIDFILNCATILLKFDLNSELVIKYLTYILNLSQESWAQAFRLKAANILLQFNQNHEQSIEALMEILDLKWDEWDQDIPLKAAKTLLEVNPNNDKAINTVIRISQNFDPWSPYHEEGLNILEQIDTNNWQIISTLVNQLGKEHYRISETLAKIGVGNSTLIRVLIEKMCNSPYEGYYEHWEACSSPRQEAHLLLQKLIQKENFPDVIALLKNYLTDSVREEDPGLYSHCYGLVWYCVQDMTYPEFYQAWHDQLLYSHPEVVDRVPSASSATIQALENQFVRDIASQLQVTDLTYPIVINASALEGETDTSTIAQELCNQIYLVAFPNEQDIPNNVSNFAQLKSLIPQIKKRLQKPNLALILDKCNPNQTLVAFCRKLTDIVHIAWITNEPLEPPLSGFTPNQSNLIDAIQSWIYQIS